MLIAFILQAIGLMSLSLSMDKHFKAIFNQPLNATIALTFKTIGWLLMMISLLLVVQMGVIFLLYWMALLSFGIIFIAISYCVINEIT